MKNIDLFKAMNDIDPQLIEEADQAKTRKIKAPWTKWVAVAACFCLCALIGFGVWQGGSIGNGNGETTVQGTENILTDKYIYKVDEGQFSSYVAGKVIAADKVGGKIADVTLTAGWMDLIKNEWSAKEKLRGEVYSINGVANDVAVALKFIDKGDAVTTTHYYVIMNPDADLSAVEEYIIGSASSDKSGASSSDGLAYVETTGPSAEIVITEKYVYGVDEGQFSSYVGGKVIAEDKVGGKIANVTLTAGWISLVNNEWLTEEKLRGEVYSINGVANDVAVALKFIDKGEAVTTTHYYVIMNPDADLSAVEEYIIGSASSDKSGASSSDGLAYVETTAN